VGTFSTGMRQRLGLGRLVAIARMITAVLAESDW
jgi:hypothetical protein